MHDLLGQTIPLRIVLHVNMDRGGGRFDWDGMAQNPETGDLVAMFASVANLRRNLGPELSRMLLWTQQCIHENEEDPEPESSGSSTPSEDVPVVERRSRLYP